MNNLKISKKAMFSYIVVIIIFLIILLIFISFQLRIKDTTEQETSKTICKASVKKAALMNNILRVFESEINCPTSDIYIDTKDENFAKAKIAESMYDCWNQFLEGKENLFSDENIYCSVCSRVHLEDPEIDEFSRYLATKKVPGKKYSYLDYISGYSTQGSEEVLGKLSISQLKELENETIYPDDYAVIFVHAKGKDHLEKLSDHFSGKTTAGKIGYIGAGTAAGTGLVIAALVSNPVGWIVGGSLGTASLVTSYLYSPDNYPEWASFVVFRKYESSALEELGCQYLA